MQQVKDAFSALDVQLVVVTFQGGSVKTLKKAFRDSVDDYLAFCEERNEAPEKPFSGKFNVRLDPELHREAYAAARTAKMSLNTWVAEAIKHEAREAR